MSGEKRNIIEIFCHRYKATLLFFGLCLAYSIFGYTHISKENHPEVKIPYISVLTILKGSSAEDVDRMVTKPIERKLQGLQNVKKITSTSAFGYGYTLVEFIADADAETCLRKVKDKVDEVKPDLPDDIEEPTISEIDVSKFPVLYVMLVGNVSKKDLIRDARLLKKEIESLKNVLEVNITGDSDDIVEIIPDMAKMKVFGMSADEIYGAIARNNVLIPLGKMRNNVTEYNVKLSGLVKTVDDIKNLPIRRTKNGTIYMRDIASVVHTFERPDRVARVNGSDALVLEISKRSGANVIHTIDAVKAAVEKKKPMLNKDVKISYSRDSSDQIKESITDLQNNVILASLLVVLIIILSIGKKQSLIIGISIPFSFLMGMGTVYMMGYTLNIVVLFGFILAVGMIVDASTIVTENADKLIQQGMKLKQAYIKSAARMAVPVLSATIGIIVVYMPLLFWPGIIGKFMKYIPIVIILVLSYSILCAMLVVPVVAFTIEKTPLRKLSSKNENAIFDKLTPLYEKLLNYVITNPKAYVKKVCIGVLMCFIAYQFLSHGTTFFPDIEPRNIAITMKSRGNMSLDNKIRIAKQVEERVMRKIKNEIKVVYSKIGDPREADSTTTSDTFLIVDIELVDWQKRRRSKEIIKDIYSELSDISGVQIEVEKDRMGPRSGKPLEIKILSSSLDKIDYYADAVAKYMADDKDFKDIDDTRASGKMEIVVDFDKNLGSLYGIGVSDLYYPLASMTKGYTISEFRHNDIDDAVDIVIKVPRELQTIKEMENLTVYSPTHRKNIAVSNFAKFRPNKEQSFIKRTDGYYSVAISSNVAEGVVANNKLMEMQKWIDKTFKNQKDVQFVWGGDMEEQQETGAFLISAFFIAICIKFLILVWQYNSVYYAALTMSAVVLSIGGVLVMFIITGKPFCVAMGGLGIISIAGVVVSNNIVLIDTFQELINKHKMPTREAVIKTALSRLRPVLITTTTTVSGLLPMMFNVNFDFFSLSFLFNAPSGQWWEELATTIAGGVCFSLILTLTFTPAMLMLHAPRDEEDD